MSRSLRYLLTVFLVSVFGVAEGQSRRLVFMPQWTVQSQFAGYYVALEKGFYKELGLEVEIVHPSASNSALNALKDGSCNIITLQLMQAMISIDAGMEVVNILQTSQRNSLLIIPRHQDISSLEDLKGRKVGIWKAGFGELGYILDKEKKLDINWIPFINSVNLFISGAIDATLAMTYNEYLQILACGIKPAKVFRFSELGYDIPEEGLYVMAEYYRQHPQDCEAFAEASRKGWEWVRKHPEEALDIVMEYARRGHIKASRVLQRRMLEEILRLQCAADGGIPTFTLLPEHVANASLLLRANGFTGREISYSEITGQ